MAKGQTAAPLIWLPEKTVGMFFDPHHEETAMPQFLIERQISGAGKLSGSELQAISQKSCGVLHEMNSSGKDVQWVHSYVTGDKIYCVYNAPDEQAVREHATKGGFPANTVMEVARTISPITAERSD